MTGLYWLPEPVEFRTRLRRLAQVAPADAWEEAVALARTRLDFLRTNQLDTALRELAASTMPTNAGKRVRLAILSSCTMTQLQAGIRVGGLRRRIPIDIYEGDYGQYWQDLDAPESALQAFRPNVILLALDGHHLAAGVTAAASVQDIDALLEEVLDRIRACWRLAREKFGAAVIHQLPLAVHPPLLGANEHRLPGSKAGFLARLSTALRPLAEQERVDLLTLDERAARDGLVAWYDEVLWHRAKQEISPAAAPLYGDLVGRLLAAQQGRSYKCLVLDLDNTLWGGVVGDDGLEGLILGQGSALGEAFVAFQAYVRDLSRRGIILAVCSKNDAANALEPFERHPEMLLRPADIACFVANWSDKASNLRAIAEQLAIGLDSLVFVDDNPFERDLVRQELPMVAVPELGDDPTWYARTLADGGYFEGVAVTQEDRDRGAQYQENRMRDAFKASATDLPSYLRGLNMELIWRRFDQIGLARTVQLINKTNQFNLTTRRYSEADVLSVMRDNSAFGLQLRLLDRFGDNGIIAIVIGRMSAVDGVVAEQELQAGDLVIDTWLMSCRVLGRQVEPTTLNLVAEQAQRLGARRLVGVYLPTSKNGMVRDHYEKLGFQVTAPNPNNATRAVLDLATFRPADTFISVREG